MPCMYCLVIHTKNCLVLFCPTKTESHSVNGSCAKNYLYMDKFKNSTIDNRAPDEAKNGEELCRNLCFVNLCEKKNSFVNKIVKKMRPTHKNVAGLATIGTINNFCNFV